MEVGNSDSLNTGEIRYFITGTELGETKITMTSGIEDKTISSPAYTIQVSVFFINIFHSYYFINLNHNKKLCV